eukprot:scaffold119982_cov63-Phaeocystis_antarctica.AAC.1
MAASGTCHQQSLARRSRRAAASSTNAATLLPTFGPARDRHQSKAAVRTARKGAASSLRGARETAHPASASFRNAWHDAQSSCYHARAAEGPEGRCAPIRHAAGSDRGVRAFAQGWSRHRRCWVRGRGGRWRTPLGMQKAPCRPAHLSRKRCLRPCWRQRARGPLVPVGGGTRSGQQVFYDTR